MSRIERTTPSTKNMPRDKHMQKANCSTTSERIENIIYYTDEIIPTFCTITNFIPRCPRKKKLIPLYVQHPQKNDILRGKKREDKRKTLNPPK